MTRFYQRLVRAARDDQSRDDQALIARNGLKQILANSLQAAGDQVVNAKTVLPWLLASAGAPSFFIGLLVPIRESGSMLPQAALAPLVARRHRRTLVWVAGSVGQAIATAGLALTAAVAEGATAGWAVLVALAVFALSRSLCSLAGKDVLGRTVPKGERGQITGLSMVLAGVAAITLGLVIRIFGGAEVPVGLLALLLGGAALTWVAAAVVYASIREPDDQIEQAADAPDTGWARMAWELVRSDAVFRRFVWARSLLLVSALSPPFVVALAATVGNTGLETLGPFIIAQGLASVVGGRPFGRWADRSSRSLMMWGAALASLVVGVFLVALLVPGGREQWWLYPLTYLLLALSHTAARVARKTYIVNVAEGNQRTRYVAVANSAMGVLILVAGAISGALALFGAEVGLLFLAVLGVFGVLVSRALPEVEGRGPA